MPGNSLNSPQPAAVKRKLAELLPLCSSVELADFDQLVQFPSMTSLAERHALFYLSLTASLAGNIIEIGSWLGGTTSYLAKGCQLAGNGKVIAIDHFAGNPGKEALYQAGVAPGKTIFATFQSNIARAGVSEYIEPLEMDSVSAREIVTAPARMVFIDGNHDYEHVREDIGLWEPLLMPGGVLAFHDFNSAEGVTRGVTEFVAPERYSSCVLVDSLLIFFRNR